MNKLVFLFLFGCGAQQSPTTTTAGDENLTASSLQQLVSQLFSVTKPTAAIASCVDGGNCDALLAALRALGSPGDSAPPTGP